MADKQQNITVNYRFNTADIERASAILSRANQASNQLQQSGQKAGQGVSQGFSAANRSIVAMETELARLKTLIEVTTDTKRLTELSAQYKKLAIAIREAKNELMGLPKEQKKLDEATKSSAQSFGSLLAGVRAVVTAGIAREIFNTAMNMATLAGNVEGVERAFNNRFANAPALLGKLQKATHGAVTDFELMQRTLQATNLGVSVEKLPTLLEFAAARAQQTGQSVDYLVESIVNGIGRKSPLILDNLGISAVRLKEKFDGATLASQSIADVTEAVGEIIEEEMGKSGGYIDTVATKVKQSEVAWQQLYETIAKKSPVGGWVADLSKMTAEGLTDLTKIISGLLSSGDAWKEVDADIQKATASREANAVVERDAYKEFKQNQEAKIKYLAEEITLRLNQVNEYDALIKKDTDRAMEILNTKKFITYAQQDEIDGIKESVKRYEQRRDTLKQTIEFLREYVIELRKQQEAETQDPGLGIIEAKKKQIEELEQQILKTQNASDLTQINIDKKGNATMQVGRLIKQLEIAQAELADLQRAFTDKIDPKPFKLKIEDAGSALLEFEANIKRIEIGLQNVQLALPDMVPKPADTVAKLDTFWTEMGKMWEENWRDLTTQSVDFQANAINSMLEGELDALDAQMSQLKNHYKQQQELAGDNQRARSELRVREDREIAALAKKQFEREKSIRKSQVIVDGAAAAIKAFVTAPNVYVAIAQAALIAATVAAQLRNIEKSEPRFAEGVIDLKGPGTGTSDSIRARLSKGESVMTAWETKHAGDALRDIRAKKLDNKVLNDLKQGRNRPVLTPSFDDTKIIKAIEANKPPDVVEQSNIVYNVRQHTETMRIKQRSKAMNI